MILRHEDRDADKAYHRCLVPKAQALAASVSPRGTVVVDDHAERWPCEGGAWVAARVWLADPEPAEQAPPAVAAIPGMGKGCGETQERGGRTHTCTAHIVHADGTATHLDEATSASWLIRTGGRP
jgi:hypothetical protein